MVQRASTPRFLPEKNISSPHEYSVGRSGRLDEYDESAKFGLAVERRKVIRHVSSRNRGFVEIRKWWTRKPRDAGARRTFYWPARDLTKNRARCNGCARVHGRTPGERNGGKGNNEESAAGRGAARIRNGTRRASSKKHSNKETAMVIRCVQRLRVESSDGGPFPFARSRSFVFY